MNYVEEKNQLWKNILKKRISNDPLCLPKDLFVYLESWVFTDFGYEESYEEGHFGEDEEELVLGIRYWTVTIENKVMEFKKIEHYDVYDVLPEWKYECDGQFLDFEEYLTNRFHLEIDQLIWTLDTIDELIFTI